MKALNAILVALIVTSANTASAAEMPDALQIGSLVCEIFTSEGAYFCVDTTPTQQGQASNTLILEHKDLMAMGAKAKTKG